MIIREKHCVCRAPLSPLRLPPRSSLSRDHSCARISPFFSAPSCYTHEFCLEGSLVVFSRIIGEKRLVISEKLRYLFLLYYFELVYLLVCFFFAGNMANVCDRCKCSMSSHDNHAMSDGSWRM